MRGDGAWDERVRMDGAGGRRARRRETWEIKSTEEDSDGMWGDEREGDAEDCTQISGLSNGIDSGSANYSLQSRPIPLPIFVYMVLWAHSCVLSFTYCDGCFHATRCAAPGTDGSGFS